MSDAKEAQAAPASREPLLSFLYSPIADINYNFISLVYALASLLCIGLYVLDVVLKVESSKGYWLIFSPFIPGLLWALYMRAGWLKLLAKQEAQKKKD